MKNTYKLRLVWNVSDGADTGTLDVSEKNCTNWQDVILAYKRADYDSVVRSFTTSFQFVDTARETLLRLFAQWGSIRGYIRYWEDQTRTQLGTRTAADFCRVELYILQEDFTFTAAPTFTCDIDFGTLKDKEGVLSISAIDNSLSTKIKKAGSTKQTFTTEEANVKNFCYIGVPPLCRTWNIITGVKDGVVQQKFDGANKTSGKFKGGRTYGKTIYFQGVYIDLANPAKINRPVYDAPVATITDGRQIANTAKSMDIRAVFTLQYTAAANVNFTLIRTRRDATIILRTAKATTLEANAGTRIVSYELEWRGETERGDILRIVAADTAISYALILTDADGGEYDAEVTYTKPTMAGTVVYKLPAFTVGGLLAKLSERITGDVDKIRVQQTNDTLNSTLLFSTGFLNSTEKGVFEISYNDIKEWLAVVFDFVPRYDDETDTVCFVPRSGEFGDDTEGGLNLEEGEVTNLTLQASSSLIYHSLQAGYNVQEYDNADYLQSEPNQGAITYTDGAPANSDKQIKCISHLRADTFGIETAIDNYDGGQTESGDIFFIHTESVTYPDYDDESKNSPYPLPEGTWRIPYRRAGQASGLWWDEYAADHLCNIIFNPRRIAAAAVFQILAGTTAPLAYTSMEAQTPQATILGEHLDADLALSSDAAYYRTPRPATITFETYRQTTPDDFAALCTVKKDGLTYYGWLTDSKYYILRPKAVQYTMLINDIE